MTTLLHLSASPRGAASESLAIAATFLDAYRDTHPDDEIVEWNLWDGTLPEFGPAAAAAKMAVFAGATGEELIRKLIETAPPHLSPGGMLALEIGINQAESLAGFFAAQNYREVSARHDFGGVTRFLFARYG